MTKLEGITPDPNTAGVLGQSTNETNNAGPGVHGVSKAAGVLGESETWHGVAGISESTTGGAGVYGKSKGSGVFGESETWNGVTGISESGTGVYGKSKGSGVLGESETWHGLAGISQSTTGGAGVYGKGGQLAGLFEGNVEVQGYLAVQGKRILDMIGNVQHQLDETITRIQTLENKVNTLENKNSSSDNRFNTLQQQVNSLQNLITTVQNKEATDYQDVLVGIAELAQRLTNIGA